MHSSSGDDGGGRRSGSSSGSGDNIDAQIEMSSIGASVIAGSSSSSRNNGRSMSDDDDDEQASILANDVQANVEEQLRIEEEQEAAAAAGVAGRRNVQMDPLVAAGIDQAEALVPNRSVTLGTLFRSDSFMTIIYSIVLIITLGIALAIDWDRNCTANAPPLKTWVMVQLGLQTVSFLVNYICVRTYVSDPESAM